MSILLTIATLALWNLAEAQTPPPVQTVTIQEQPALPPPLPEPDLRGYVERAVEMGAVGVSTGRKSLLIDMLRQIAEQRFSDPQHRFYWVALIGAESAYNSKAKSHAGAVGLGQLIPRYRQDFGASCGVTDITEADIQDDYVNLWLSACYFRALIEQQGTVPLALVAYNAGMNSADLKKAKSGASPSTEPSAYVTRIWIKEQQARGNNK
jgi:hypothetical protein